MLGERLFQSVLYASELASSNLNVVGEPSSTPGLKRLPRPVTFEPGTNPEPGPVTPKMSLTVAVE